MARREFTTKTRKEALKRSGTRCEAAGCDLPIFRRTLCAKHYSRLLRYGDVEVTKRVANGDPLGWLLDYCGHNGNDCLTFPYPRNPSGYGRVTYNGERMGAHRAMCFLVRGNPPSQKHEAAHSCGNGHLGCVNPNHLRWATRSENLADRVEHYGGNRGARHGNSKLSTEVVRDILSRIRCGELQSEIASQFGVNQTTVSKIKRGVLWGWLNG